MALREYRRKRDFSRTLEPAGGRSQGRFAFVVQKHDASHLHYDFRLEHDGVLWSWAVPKGPVLDPAEKRLAVQVEDHPLEYRKFEGTIPKGQYGGGTVMVWDQGRWQPAGDPAEDYRAGRLHFVLQGEKLHGAWNLVRMAARRGGGSKPQWLLIKSPDEFARPLRDGDVLEGQPNCVISGRSLEEIAAGKAPSRTSRARRTARKQVRQPGQRTVTAVSRAQRKQASRATRLGGTANHVRKGKKKRKEGVRGTDAARVPGSRRATMPVRPRVQLATLVSQPPAGSGWLHECKFDGYRMLCRLDRGNVEWISRNGRSWTDRMQPLSPDVVRLHATTAILDGEVVVLDRQGISNFQVLQNALGDPAAARLTYYVFDLLYLDGFDLTESPLRERRACLQSLLRKSRGDSGSIRLSDHLTGPAAELARRACQVGWEGIVSKRADAPYRPGRGMDWLKSKCRQGQEFVIGGFTRTAGSRQGFGTLLVGYYSGDGELIYAGKVGTRFTRETLRSLTAKLRGLEQPRTPFSERPRQPGLRGVRWLKPRLVAQIEFNNWTQDGLLRQAAFQGLRDDKPPQAVTRERSADRSGPFGKKDH